MTRRDYKILAQALAEAKPPSSGLLLQHKQWQDIVESITASLASENPRFKKTTFFLAIDKAEIGETDAA